MKKQFQSKSVPRGTRTIWRYLGALFLLFTFAIGNVWAAETSIVFSSSNKDDSNTAFGAFNSGKTITAGDSIIKIFSKNNSNWSFSNTNKKGYRADRDKFVFHFTGAASLSVRFSQNSTNGVYLKLAPFTTTKKYVKDIVESDFSTTGSALAFASVVSDNSFADAATISVADNKLSWTWSKKGGVKVTWENIPAGWYELQLNGTNESYIYGFTANVTDCSQPATALSLSSDAPATIYAGTEITFSTSGGNGGAITIEGAASETITANKWTATEGEHTFTASQPKTDGKCAQEEELKLTVLAATPVSTVTVNGPANGYKNNEVIFAATAANATQYRWTVDGVAQGSDSAKLHFTPTESKTYSIVCEAKNAFNSDWVASTAHSLTVSSLYGDLIHFTAKTSGSSINEDLPAANIGGIVGGTVHQKSQSNAKLNSGGYYSLTLASGSFQAGDTVRIVVKPEGDNHSVPATLMLSSLQNNSNPIGSVSGLSAPTTANITADIILTVGAQTIFLSRDGTVSSQNPIVVSMAVIRPMAAKSVAYDLTAVKINGTAISAAELATLKTADAYMVDLMAGYAASPVVKFARQTTTTYEDDSQKVATDTITVTASEVSSKWQAQATIGPITYTVKAAKQSSAKVYYYDGETKLGEEPVAIGGHPAEYAAKQSKNLATFVDWYSDADLADGHLISDIAAMTVSEDVSVYGKWTYTYAQSVNVEKWVLDNTKTPNSDKTGALISLLGTRGFASNLAYVEKNLELDSLNDSKGTGRNYTYLGLKVKSAGKLLDFRLAKDNTVKVKFGNVGATPLLAINGGEYAAMTIVDGVFAYTATGNDYISIKTATDAAVVFQQIMIGEDIQDVTLPEPTRHAVDLTKAGETEHGTLAVASPEEYNWLAKDVEVTLTVAADEGYYIESVTLNGEALTPSENVYSFAMPNAKANVVATFAEIVPNNVTYKANNGGADADILAENATEIAGCSFTYAGHKFNGWNTAPDGTGNAYAEGDAVLSPLTLYAQWKEYFVITYMDGEDVLGTEEVFVGEAPVGIADPVKAMNIFQGWTLAGSDDVIDVTSLNATTMVYAKWEAIDACFYFSAKSVTEDEAITAPANLDNAFGGTLEATDGTFTYTQYGVLIAGGGSKYFTVNLDYALQEGSKITVKMAAGNSGDRGLNICYEANKDRKDYDGMHWEAAAIAEEKTFEYTLTTDSKLIGKKVFYLYRNNNVYLQTVMVKDCAPQDYTVTYKDGETILGTEQVFENEHPTADGINTHKKGYEFQGWAETVDGAVVDLDDITITAAKNLFAQYTVKDCSPKGVKFSMAIDGSKISANQYYPATTPAVGDLAVFATVTGGVAQAVNTSTGSTKNFEVKTTPEFKLGGNNSHMRILLDCPLAENDTIKFEKTERITLSFDSLKTKSENIAKNTSYYIVPAAYAGEDTIHIWYNSNGVSVNGVQVIRPEIYTVSFDLNGHGSAIAPMDVVKGAKITAPTAPEDEDYAFAGWYKENTLSNEWKFDVDVVTANTTLFAKWIDLSDATLKSLKYGAEEIVLQAGVYTYNVELPALTTAVPALTAETSNPNATKVITDETAFDAEGHASSTVVVTPEKVGAATQTYTVNFAKAASVALQDVTGSITWDFSKTGITAETNFDAETVMANIPAVNNDENFWSDKIQAGAGKLRVGYYQGGKLMFHTTVPGLLKVEFSNTGSSARPYRELLVNGNPTGAKSKDNTHVTYTVAVKSGDIELTARIYDNDGNPTATTSTLNFYLVDFDADLSDNAITEDAFNGYNRGVTEGRYGTICLPNGGIMVGAELFEIAYYGETSHKIFLDNIPSGEMEAGVPYIFLPNEGADKLAVFYTDEANESAKSANGLIGYIGASEDPSDAAPVPYNEGNYILNNNQYREVVYENSAYVLSHRAYIKLAAINPTEPALAPGRRRVALGVQSEQVATGCENLNVSDKPVKMIINGQLFILRGEKMYDAKGQLVK